MIIIKNVVIKKYGGTSLGTIKRIKFVTNQIKKDFKTNSKLIIVVSAMGTDTNQLNNLAKKIASKPNPRELDMLLSTGEQKSIALLTIALNAIGLKSKSFTGSQCQILTNSDYNHARIQSIDKKKITLALDEGFICIIAGFQGVTLKGDITTLGRGGSDTTAVALAAAFGTKICEIYTDVDGIYTVDPNIHLKARRIDQVSYCEMLELSKLGATVIHPRAVEIAVNYNIELVIKSNFINSIGTRICRKDKNMENFNIKGISVEKNVINFSIEKLPNNGYLSYELINRITQKNISLDMIIQNLKNRRSNHLSFVVSEDDYTQSKIVCDEFLNEYPTTQLICSEVYSKISIVGLGINNHPEILNKFLKCISRLEITIECLTTSQMKISCLINQKSTEKVIKSLHNVFFLDQFNSKNTAI